MAILSFTISLPAITANPLFAPVVAGAAIAATIGVIGYKLYKSVKRFKALSAAAGEKTEGVKATAKAYVKHKAKMALGATPRLFFYIGGMVFNQSFWAGVRRRNRDSNFLTFVAISVVAGIGETVGTLGVYLGTAYQPIAKAYRLDYKRQEKLYIANGNNVVYIQK